MAVLRAYRRLFSNPPLARLLLGEFISSIGDWLYLVALLIVIYERGATTAVLGVVGATRVLPYVFLSLPAGIVADRFDRRMVLLVTDVARGLVMLALTWLAASEGSLIGIVALTILATCFSAFFGPAIGSYLPGLVRDERELGPANSAYASLDNLAFIIGPAVAALLISLGGLTLAFLLNAVSFGFVAVMLWFLPPSRAAASGTGRAGATNGSEPAQGEPYPAEGDVVASGPITSDPPPRRLRDELRDPRIVRPLVGLTFIELFGGFVFGGLTVLTVVLAVDVLRAGEEGTGALNAAIGLGGLIGALASGALVLRRNLAGPLIGGGLLLGAGLVVLGLTSSLAVALLASVVLSAGVGLVEIVSTTLFQRVVPDRVRGRVLGAIATISVTTYAAGSLLVPVIAGPLGVGPVLMGCGIAMALATAFGVVLIGPGVATPAGVDGARARLARIDLFAGLPPGRLEDAMRAAHVVAVDPATIVIRQGDHADRFYVIASGRVEVAQVTDGGGADIVLRRQGADEVFGEIGLLTGSPRTATVTAIEPTTLVALDGPDFLRLVGAGPGLTSRLLDLHRGATAAAG